jgi:hypothetical protein
VFPHIADKIVLGVFFGENDTVFNHNFTVSQDWQFGILQYFPTDHTIGEKAFLVDSGEQSRFPENESVCGRGG